MFALIRTISFIAASFILTTMMMGMNAVDKDDNDVWPDDDVFAKALAVNEGDLEFLATPPSETPHLLKNALTIQKSSLNDGWVDLVQCHENLDSVSATQILYHDRRTRNLKVLSSHAIEKTWVEGNTIQMENIGANATICVGAQVKALHSNYDGSYSMRNGPFLRKFLDGYYPMHVTMDVNLPGGKLQYEAIQPQEQAGFKVTHNKDHMQIDALFVGELSIEIYFSLQTTAVN